MRRPYLSVPARLLVLSVVMAVSGMAAAMPLAAPRAREIASASSSSPIVAAAVAAAHTAGRLRLSPVSGATVISISSTSYGTDAPVGVGGVSWSLDVRTPVSENTISSADVYVFPTSAAARKKAREEARFSKIYSCTSPVQTIPGLGDLGSAGAAHWCFVKELGQNTVNADVIANYGLLYVEFTPALDTPPMTNAYAASILKALRAKIHAIPALAAAARQR